MATPDDETVIANLTTSVGATGDVVKGKDYASRLHHVSGDSKFTIVALPQAEREFDLSLPRGLQHADGRKLRLVLPRSKAGPVLAWSAYLDQGRRPEVWLHEDWRTATKVKLPSRKQVVQQLRAHAAERTKTTGDLTRAVEKELRYSSEPMHLGKRGAYVHDLIEWATSRDELDPSHNRGSRSWQYRGRKVLEIKPARSGIHVIAGINGKQHTFEDVMPPTELSKTVAVVEDAVRTRRTGKHRKADEAWLQSFIAGSPKIVGVEGRVFREVPAWRPKGYGEAGFDYGRGFIDVLGVDGHGTIRIVETKLPSNSDAPAIAFQGIDYLAYCEAYRDPICRRLDVNSKATLALRYVIGQEGPKQARLHPAAVASLEALDPSIEYDVQGITRWDVEPGNEHRGRSVAVVGAPRTWPKPLTVHR